MTRHIAIDLETLALGTRPAIVQIGLVVFNADEIIGRHRWDVDYTEDIRAGGEVDGDTLRWWAGQSLVTRLALTASRRSASAEALRWAMDKATTPPEPAGWWANGIDLVWLESMWYRYNPPGVPFPVPYNRRFDMRTLRKTVGRNITVERDPAYMHDALEDALWVARWLQEAHRQLGGVL